MMVGNKVEDVEFLRWGFTRAVLVLDNLPIFIFINCASRCRFWEYQTLPGSSASPLSSIPIRMLVLLALCTTCHGRLKLLSRPNTQMTPFRTLADKEEWLEEDLK